jgi:hypothetical protein
MRRELLVVLFAAGIAANASAQDYYPEGGYAQDYSGSASIGSQEQLFPFDDQEPWKHGYRQVMPYYGGFHKFRPYNYHHVFGQTQTAASYGLQHPYSQQFWLRYQSVPGGNMLQYPAYNWNGTPIGQYPYPGYTPQQWAAPAAPNALTPAAPNEAAIMPPSPADSLYVPPPPGTLNAPIN